MHAFTRPTGIGAEPLVSRFTVSLLPRSQVLTATAALLVTAAFSDDYASVSKGIRLASWDLRDSERQ